MADISANSLVAVGLIILIIGVVMPTETTETTFEGTEVVEKTENVPYKEPTIVVGIGLLLAGIVARDTENNNEYDNLPD
jgi:ABC-type sulfate transport system permease component